MRADVEHTMKRSSRVFVSQVWPVLADWCGGGQIIPVETKTDSELASQLDMLAGVDAWQVVGERPGMRGIASRVQWIRPTNWDTFTIRYSVASGSQTEYQKRLYAVTHPDEGLVLPGITVHAYIVGDQLWSAAAVWTSHLIRCAQDGLHWFENNPQDRATDFMCVSWHDLVDWGAEIYVYRSLDSLAAPPGRSKARERVWQRSMVSA